MKKLNNKAFTLLELLAVIIIISAVGILIIPSIKNYIDVQNDKYYNSLAKELEIITKDYYIDNKSLLPNYEQDKINTKILNLNKLVQEGYITNEVLDKSGGKCTNTYIVISNDKGDLSYDICFKCENHTTNKDICNE